MVRVLFAGWIAVCAAVGLFAPAPAQDSPAAGTPDDRIPGLMVYEVESAMHRRGAIPYDVIPPAGGEHHPIWQDCGFYQEPIRDRHAVHSQEHGAVWVTYDPALDGEQLALLEQIAAENPYVLASPYQDLPSPLVASAWGAQLYLDSADDPRLFLFLREFIGAGPEPGAACTDGTSNTVTFPAGTPVATPAATPG